MKCGHKKLLLASAFVLLLILSFQRNIFAVAPSAFFDEFQNDSETLVIGRIVADENSISLPSRANLAFVGVESFIYIPTYIYQSYALIGRRELQSLQLTTAPLNDQNWIGGVSRHEASVVVLGEPLLGRYVGREVQIQGETRVIKAVTYNYQFANVQLTGRVLPIDETKQDGISMRIAGAPASPDSLTFRGYVPQYGIQGSLFSKIYFWSGRDVSRLNLFASVVFALVVVAMTFSYASVVSRQFAIFFALSVIFSPWLVSFAKNLYWIPFAWFLPAAFALSFFFVERLLGRLAVCVLLYGAFVFKFLAGYEYLTSVILFAAAPYLYLSISSSTSELRVRAFRGFVGICFIGLAAFFTALVIHSTIRGDTIWQGLQSIYEADVKRRTYGDPSRFDPFTASSLKSSPVEVIAQYVTGWKTEVLKLIPGKRFFAAIVFALAVLTYRVIYGLQWRKDFGLFFSFALVPLSWFVLAKGHSYIHTQINFVLWYFGFVAVLMHVSFNGLKLIIFNLAQWVRMQRVENL